MLAKDAIFQPSVNDFNFYFTVGQSFGCRLGNPFYLDPSHPLLMTGTILSLLVKAWNVS